MTSRRIIASGLAIFAFAITLFSLNPHTTAQDALSDDSAPEWEYKIADARPMLESIDLSKHPSDKFIKEKHEQFLNEQGKGGWELVSYVGSMATYKRQVTSAARR